MKITRDNYESFFIDYFEGNMPESTIDQFLDFLNQNPDLKEELHLFEEVNLPEEHIVFQEKKQLHKNEAEETRRLENIAIAYLEGDWDADENKTIEDYLSANPEFKREYDLIAKTQLKPDLGIKYPDRQKLYRKSSATIVMNWTARTAAVVILIWGIHSVIPTQNNTLPEKAIQKLAEVSPKPALSWKNEGSGKTFQRTVNPAKNKPEIFSKHEKAKTIQEKIAVKYKEKESTNPEPTDRKTAMLASLSPIQAQLEYPTENHLAFPHSGNPMKINEPKHVMTIDEFLASRAKKVSKEGLFSVQRIARLGLNLASELSGERIGYQTKDGKITSVEFESKLMAFSIPLEKK
jgi:hypothetical protein